jgi:hypothetical protein
LRYREKSSFTLARATRRGWGSLSCEPGCRFCFWDDGEDLDCRFGDVTGQPDLTNSEAILGPIEAAQALDATPAHPLRLVSQVQRDRVFEELMEGGREDTPRPHDAPERAHPWYA